MYSKKKLFHIFFKNIMRTNSETFMGATVALIAISDNPARDGAYKHFRK